MLQPLWRFSFSPRGPFTSVWRYFMLDLAYVTLLDFLSRSPPLRVGRDEPCEPRFVPIVGEDKDSREEVAPPDIAGDRPEKSWRT
ncbi:hypothetical protein [Methylocystis sp. SB2]|uniref:hypothetical protein n=1 Tax=Methylocystis sp. (strain SB2) TaxID=743836 RepID=UPI000562631F|nr:hypothetical protein [Methylocystis sp. SB2]ULO24146.1 hypothetical protein LNB28_01670 [Methylocystis sp. SB2]